MIEQHPVRYLITPINPAAHLFEVQCIIHAPDPAGQILSLPAWIPGSYMIRDFAKNIVTISAVTMDGGITMRKIDKQTWQCAATDKPVTITYTVYAWDLSVRTAHLDTNHGFFNGSSVFLSVAGKENLPCDVEILPPHGEQYKSWRLATTLPRHAAGLYEFGVYYAKDYDELIDHPVEMGNFDIGTFEVAGVPHDIILTGKHRADIPRICDDLQKICSRHVALFGELPPMERYMFLTMIVGSGYGGLEHRSSTSLLVSRNDLPLPGDKELSEEYCNFLGLCSHEYFHTWNVKRIKPEAFLPYQLQSETYTRQLWAFEGITSYYDDLALLRSGVIDEKRYLELLGQTATRVWRTPGRLKQSVADSSFDAWTKFYKQDENAPNAIVSYYAKGALIALALDLTIRKMTNHAASLDDMMHILWQEYGKPLLGVPEGKIEQLAAALAGGALDEFFNRYLYGTEDLPLAELLQDKGINFTLRAALNMADKGGKPADKPNGMVTLGARFTANPAGAGVSHVFDRSAAQQAGVSAGDILIAVDHLKVDQTNIEKVIAGYPAGTEVTLHAFRRDELYQCQAVLQSADRDTCVIDLKADCSSTEENNRNQWLYGSEPRASIRKVAS
ncbi:MAG: PDZ domain-containing protein [Gammaproteobacteria bacterium]|nr:PDZ domain-containing protein [Gammaproteobacteria bacterium]MDH5652277.1 PDZ domain-containing protein [Gammaproteobacteria bacterium]